jgi:glycosyltransferase involved in cell wall biosynthesis
MSNKYKITVVLPTYNVEKYILRCLDSLKKQTLNDFEIIFVDDCGKDNSINIIKEYAKFDNRIKIIYNEKNIGTYHSRRVGVENANGQLVVFLDPDDELEENTLKLLYHKFLESKAEVIFYGVTFVPKISWYKNEPYMYPKNKDKSLLVSYFSNGTKSYVWGTPGKAFEKEFLINVYKELNVNNSFRFVYAEDAFLLINIMLFRPSYTKLMHRGYIYYNNPTSITMENPKKMNEKIEQYDYMIEEIDNNVRKIQLL